MITYNGNFVSKIKYNGTELDSLKWGNTTVWQAPYIEIRQGGKIVLSGSQVTVDREGDYIDFIIIYNVPLTQERSATWFSSPNEDQEFRVSDILSNVDEALPSVTIHQWRVEFRENTGASRTGTLTLRDSLTGDILWTCTFRQAGITWTTNSCTCTASPTSYNTTYLNSTTTYTASVIITSYATETSSEGGSRTVAVTPTASISNSNIITGISFSYVSGHTYRMTVNHKRNVIGSSTVTVKTSRNGKTDTATYTIRVAQSVTQKTMTLVFRQAGIQNVFLFSGPATSNLSTSAIKAYVMPGDTDRLTISWTSTLFVNSPTGGSAQISEGQQFYVYYAASGVSYINQCVLASTRPTLKDGATVQLL